MPINGWPLKWPLIWDFIVSSEVEKKHPKDANFLEHHANFV